MTTYYVPVWVSSWGAIGRGIPVASLIECRQFFQERVEAGIKDRAYHVEKNEVTLMDVSVIPLGQLTPEAPQ